MLDISGIRIPVDQLDGTLRTEELALRKAVRRRLHITPDDLLSVEPRKRSIDARKKNDVHFLYTARVALRGGANAERALLAKLRAHHAEKNVRTATDKPFGLPAHLGAQPAKQPVVIGAGCAGLFCALALAEAGLRPLLVERGQDATRRSQAIERFNQTGKLDPESNIQFGLGGAGTFSDGKLATGTKSPAHRFILQTFVDAGAPREILWDAKPHVGSDILPTVVTNILNRIRDLGGEVRLECRLTDIGIARNPSPHVTSVTLEWRDAETGLVVEEQVPTDNLVLACGHSARDVFELLKGRGVTLERKTFAMGVRIEHLQSMVDKSQYGPFAGHPALGAAPYKLVSHLADGRSAFSFCMCPGGYVVAAASEPGGVVTNGMSLSDRAGTNANSGFLANVFPTDLPGDDVLEGVTLQRRCERAAFEAGGGNYVAPAQLVADFLQGVSSSAQGSIVPTYPRGVAWGSVEKCLPPYITETLRASIPKMAHQLRGFDTPDAVLTGVETRSSSPVRVTRGKDCQSVSTHGLWPCGEGAGYAGGIMSAATDGLRVAQALVDSLR
ncbi:MAG: FAD-binding protein [Olsenella sp.]|nr:FAD-binding protein [Olsenella sp.]